MVGIPVLIVDSTKLTLNTSCLVEDVVVFINQDISPMGDLNGLFNFGENYKRARVSVVNKNLFMREWLNILVGSVFQASRFLVGSWVRGVVTIYGINR